MPAHAQAKESALGERRRLVACVRQPRLNLSDDCLTAFVSGNFPFHLDRYGDAEQAFGKEQSNTNHAFGTDFGGGFADPRPVELRVTVDNSGDVGDPHEAFPKMFGAVN